MERTANIITVENINEQQLSCFLQEHFNAFVKECFFIVDTQYIKLSEHTQDFGACFGLVASGRLSAPDYFFAHIYNPDYVYCMLSVNPLAPELAKYTGALALSLAQSIAALQAGYVSLDVDANTGEPVQEWNV